MVMAVEAVMVMVVLVMVMGKIFFTRRNNE
jgi:hypothetical protein